MWLGRIWFEQIQRFECFSLPCSSSLFVIVSLIKVSMDEFLRLFFLFFFLFFWLHFAFKVNMSVLSWPETLLCQCMMWVYSETAEVIIVLEVLQPIEFFLHPLAGEGDIEQKNCFPPVQRRTDRSSDDNSTANFLYSFIEVEFIRFQESCSSSPHLKTNITTGRPVRVFALKVNQDVFFSWLYCRRKTAALCFLRCLWFALNVHDGNTVFRKMFGFSKHEHSIHFSEFVAFTDSHHFPIPVCSMPAKRLPA